MRSGISLVIFLVIFSQAQAEPPSVQLRVLTYNIHHAEGEDLKIDLERIGKVIQECAPDIVALQEVDQQTNRSGKVDQLQVLSQATQLEGVFAKTLDYQGGGYGNALLTRFPIVAQRIHPLPEVFPSEPRNVLEVELQVPKLEAPLTVMVTHLDAVRDDRNRHAQIAAINKLVETHPARPIILAGDFNASPDADIANPLRKEWQVAVTPRMRTFPARKPRLQLDYILTRPLNRWRILEARTIPELLASDHRPVFTVLELLPETPATEK
ncbi:endonuclease/exonuclease/phosphatase family protein [Planctomicrobium sp. SH664]|uniref:endonuclease/exonuclease/phosphatase family protein n=1 Tax=Planctomicrobium sp. SH664 TaxID=3448125 RepID=UPI003F5BF5D5